MAVVRLADVVIPTSFSAYVSQNSMESSALSLSGVVTRNGAIEDQLRVGSESWSTPTWLDLSDAEADLSNDDPLVDSVPHAVGTTKQITRKAYLHSSWSAMNLASELAGSDAIGHIQTRVTSYWQRQLERRIIASLNGILAANVANDGADMLLDISGLVGDASLFDASAVIDSTATLGDAIGKLTAIGMHSDTYRAALKADAIETIPDSQGRPFSTFRGMATIIDDLLPMAGGIYTSVLLGGGAIAYGMTDPAVAPGTEVESKPSAGLGGGQQILHSRVNCAIQPFGHSWTETTVTGESPSLAELALAGNWTRTAERKAVPVACLRHKLA